MAYYRSVGLIGLARAGKDSVAARLRQRYGYQRVAFADPVRAAALRTDPLIPTSYGVHTRLSTLVNAAGWDYAKTTYPEVRRVLQNIGQTVRDMDPDFWVRAAFPAIEAAKTLNLPVVVSDVRYENEARALLLDGFTLIRVTRPGTGLAGDAGRHKSETELDAWATDLTIGNTGSLDDLNSTVDSLTLPRN
ncbi:hypothetical protein F0344_04785 [Streptomyces finlayi]|uniref:AAA family ATPase n=1 Tax=Streptomyces finlayi TaxID=67296 RepID=A0A7G7BF93_9ACTN|nr:hypothetical protein [Streptomyces finlayi]QNE74008.1 hypothetical protein F0344_04785 [Streptomyces finlayi]